MAIEKNNLPAVDTLPILVDKTVLANIKGDEATPYELVEAIPFPSEGQGGIYTAEYFESLLENIKARPLGGSKTGHSNSNDDFFTVGGKVEYTNEKEGVCYLRILVPADGYETSNAGFIRSCKAGNMEFSIVANVEPERANDGKIYFNKDMGKARNDAVSEGAMPQSVSNSAKEKEIFELINKGLIDLETDSSELIVKGKVSRYGAVKLQSSDGKLAYRILNAIKKKLNNEGEEPKKTEVKKMDLNELIEKLKNFVTNGDITLEQIAEKLKQENKLRNADDETRKKLQETIIEVLGLEANTPVADIIKAVEEALKESEEAAEAVAETEAANMGGAAKVKNAQGIETDNPAYLYAKGKMTGLRNIKKVKNAAAALKTDPVMLSLKSQQADFKASGGEANANNDYKMREV
jgi:hypothetical protein